MGLHMAVTTSASLWICERFRSITSSHWRRSYEDSFRKMYSTASIAVSRSARQVTPWNLRWTLSSLWLTRNHKIRLKTWLGRRYVTLKKKTLIEKFSCSNGKSEKSWRRLPIYTKWLKPKSSQKRTNHRKASISLSNSYSLWMKWRHGSMLGLVTKHNRNLWLYKPSQERTIKSPQS